MNVVKLRKGALTRFRRLALHSKKEIHAYLIGLVVSPALVRVEHFVYADYQEQTECSVQPTAESQRQIAHWTIDEGLQVVGTIHSHPNWYPILSPQDHHGHIQEAHRISGVVGIMNGRTKVYFWLAESSLPMKVEYL